MTDREPGFKLDRKDPDSASLRFSGDWIQGQHTPDFNELRNKIRDLGPSQIDLQVDNMGSWDSILMAFLLQCSNYCRETEITLTTDAMPEGVQRLLKVATAVEPHERPVATGGSWLAALNPAAMLTAAIDDIRQSMAFIGEVAIALLRLVLGKANTRFSDFSNFCYQAGPDAFAIISLIGVLVGMILGYLGAVQLQQFGAEIYVADLVVIGMLREMGVLMTAVVMAGRTGAAYAAQLGTMQTNEEIDAITTMGISPIEFLVVPRMLALVVMMPLLTIYADLLGIVGISPLQYINQAETAISLTHFMVALIKSLVFAVLIAVAGCRSGINSGRSSAAVGKAATEAVVTAIIYLIVADAAINLIFQQLDI